MISSIGTYLPCWGTSDVRLVGDDEDAVTIAISAGLAALRNIDPLTVHTVELITRNFPLIEGGNGAALLGGLGLAPSTRVREQLGGAPAVLDSILSASAGTLVIAADTSAPAGAGAAYCADTGAALRAQGHVTRSMPVATRDDQGRRTDYADPRLLRVRGLGESLKAAQANAKFDVVAGLDARDARSVSGPGAARLATTGASSAVFGLAVLAERKAGGTILAVEQAAVTVAELSSGTIAVHRDEATPQEPAQGTKVDGAPIAISLSAYDRAFDSKLRLQAAKCRTCGTLAYPHRFRCISCGSEDKTDLEVLPREAEVHSLSTIYTTVPGLVTPYTVILAELGGSGIRLLVRLTGVPAAHVQIGDVGRLVLRLVAVRSGVPDYGYAFLPDHRSIMEIAS